MNSPEPPHRILSIDGGGIRTLIGIEVLAELEQRLAARYGDEQYRLCKHFDLVAGTSAGAMVAGAIALGIPMADVREFVARNAGAMFRRSRLQDRLRWRYDKTELEQNIKRWFGADTELGSPKLRTLVLLVMANWNTDSPWLVSNNPQAPFNARHLDDCNLTVPLWQLARASAAAPAFYEPQTIRFGADKHYEFVFVDGALTGFLNPAFKAFQYATTAPYGIGWPAGEQRISLLSIGSGDVRHRRPKAAAGDLGIWRALKAMPNTMLYESMREQDLLCRTLGRCRIGDPIDLEIGDLIDARTAAEPRLFTYYRFNVPLTDEALAKIGCAHIDGARVRRIDAIDQAPAFAEIGRALAAASLDRYLGDLTP